MHQFTEALWKKTTMENEVKTSGTDVNPSQGV